MQDSDCPALGPLVPDTQWVLTNYLWDEESSEV
jgi:hypothetical protein